MYWPTSQRLESHTGRTFFLDWIIAKISENTVELEIAKTTKTRHFICLYSINVSVSGTK